MRRLLTPVLALVAGAALWACAINPATGRRQLVLISESQEIQIGRENDEAISAQMGLYDDAGLQAYVQELGVRLAALSERPDLKWTFRVVDDPVVNAFALPGGYIYITRGILAHINNEAELAGVIGHEIGHVTARHGVSQMSKAQLAQLGLGLGSILAPEVAQSFGQLAEAGLSLLFLKYGRDDERQADELGLRYMYAAGYSPAPMVGVFDMLAAVSAAQSSERVPGWLSTHPAPENRGAHASAQIAALGGDAAGRRVGQEEYLAGIDGITFGEDPRAGFFRESLFLHPEMEFRFEFPSGWKLQNQRASVVGVSPERDAVVQLALAAEKTSAEALGAFFREAGITRTGPPMSAIHGLPTAGDGFTVAQEQGTLQGRVAFVEYQGKVFQLLGFTPQASWSSHEEVIRRSLASFDRLTDRSALEVEPRRLRVVRTDRPLSLEEFARRYESSVEPGTLILINRLAAGAILPPGSYKVVTGGPPEK